MPLQGKNEAIELKTVPSLVLLLKDDDINVKCKAALALEKYALYFLYHISIWTFFCFNYIKYCNYHSW